MSQNVCVKVILDTRRVKKGGLYPLKLRVSYNQNSRYLSLNKSISKDDYKKVLGKAPRKNYKEIQKLIIKSEEKAISCIDNMSEFDFNTFNSLYRGKKNKPCDVIAYISKTIEQFQCQNQLKTASLYSCLSSSLETYHEKEKLLFSHITIRFLENYEQWMLNNGKSTTTISMYLRSLRAIFNHAITHEIIDIKHYPFGKRKYQIPSGNSTKKALSHCDIKLIANYTTSNIKYLYYRDLWLFSYLANGANMVDIFSLKDDNIQEGFIVFQRKKTKRTSRLNPILIRVFITDRMQQIIDYWQPHNSSFLFPVLEENLSEEHIVRRVENAIRQINKYMGYIAKEIGISKHVTTYTARHSFSTVLKRSGASIAFISESLGHKNIATTAHYLDSFEDDEKRKWSLKLL